MRTIQGAENHRASSRRWHEQNPEYARDWHLRKTYGIGLTEYEAILRGQCGVCAACKRASDKSLHVDHDHKTGQIRGLLCGPCNQALGLLADDITRLLRLIAYLKGGE